MDNSGSSWGSSAASAVAGGALGVSAAVGSAWFAAGGDAVGAVLFGGGALALAAITAHALLVRPRLTADRHGIVVRTLSGSSRAQWAEVHARLASTRRLGRDVKTLELELGRADTEPHLIVLGRFELGAEPADVLDELERVRSG